MYSFGLIRMQWETAWSLKETDLHQVCCSLRPAHRNGWCYKWVCMSELPISKRYETRLEQCCRPISVLYSSHTSVLLQSETLLKILPDRGISSSFCFSFVFVISRVLVCAALPWANRQPNTLQKLYTWNSHFWVYVQNSPWQLAKELVRLLVQLWAVRWQQQGRIQMGRLNSSGSSSKAWTRNRLLFLSRWSACNCHCNTKTNKLAVLHSLGTFIFPGPET